jgi:dTDP-4-amino-4,6-dideoxygalactose transaminase
MPASEIVSGPRIRVSKSVVGDREQAAVAAVIAAGYLGTGPETQKFEQELTAYLGGGRPVTCVSTGTAALHLAVQACGIGPGDEVIVPSLTFVASFQAISATGAIAVPCEVDPSTCTINVDDAAARITARTRAIVPVHYASGMGRLDDVYELAARKGLRVIEDAAHAFGGEYKGRKVGSFGDVVCFSFDGIKNITSGEGGAIVTVDPAVRRHVEDARMLGIQRDTEQRYQSTRSWDFDVHHQGFRYHMSDVMAAIGRVQLSRLEQEFKPRRMELGARYRSLLGNVPGVTLIATVPDEVVPHIFPVRIRGGLRDAVRRALAERGIETGIHYKPNHLLTLYGAGRGDLPITEDVYDELVSLPLHPHVTADEQSEIIEIVTATVTSSPARGFRDAGRRP